MLPLSMWWSLAVVVLSRGAAAATPSALTTIASFSNNTFIENIAVRADGHILLSTLGETSPAAVFTVDPRHPSRIPAYYTSFPAPVTGLTGITEYAKGRFAVIAGTWNVTTRRGKGFEIWAMDTTVEPPRTQKLANIRDPSITALNGAIVLPRCTNTILIAESNIGGVYSFNIKTRKLCKVIQDPSMSPSGLASNMGINGLRIFDGHLYYTNSAQGTLNRMAIDDMGHKLGDPVVLWRHPPTDGSTQDDFIMDSRGRSWVAGHPNTITQVDVDGSNVRAMVIGPKSQIGPTSVAFGRGRLQEKILYIANGDGTVQALSVA
ncbi:hypothetical protein FAVG1_08781 [Fusarium avenaceum]|nr:hypothetical protein FAVG1_08781 [Fusarium avenaceum]